LWRFPYRRLDAEAIRDSLLAVSGRLDRRQFGPGVRPAVPADTLAGHSDPGLVWKASPGREADRRTVYVHVKRSLLVPLVEALDFCDTARSAARRTTTTVAPQALTLFNGEFANEMARSLAKRLEQEAGTDLAKQIDLLYRLTLARPPSPKESSLLLDFLKQRHSSPAAREQACRVVLNLNEFVYPD
jgi:hypothetical protein